MWLFEPMDVEAAWPSEAKQAFYIGSPGGATVTEFLISRKKDPPSSHKLALWWNPSVSRKHAALYTAIGDAGPTLKVMDLGSKVGTFVTHRSGKKERVGTKAKMVIPDACEMEIGSTRFRVTRVVAALSSCGASAAQLVAKAALRGVSLQSQPTASVMVVVMPERTVTQKAILGLCYNCRFVTPTWLDSVMERSADGIVLQEDVDPARHLPPLVDKTLQIEGGGSPTSWEPTTGRREYLKGKHMLVFHQKQHASLEAVVLGAGGTIEMVDETNCQAYEGAKIDLLRSGQTIVLKLSKKDDIASLSPSQAARRQRIHAVLKQIGGIRQISDKDLYVGIVQVDPAYCDSTKPALGSKRHGVASKRATASHPIDADSQYTPSVMEPSQIQETQHDAAPLAAAATKTPVTPAKETATKEVTTAKPASATTAGLVRSDRSSPKLQPATEPEPESEPELTREKVPTLTTKAHAKIRQTRARDDAGDAGDDDGVPPPKPKSTASRGKRQRVATEPEPAAPALFAPDSQPDEAEKDGDEESPAAAKSGKTESPVSAPVWDGPDGTPVIEFVDLVVNTAAKASRSAPKKLHNSRINFKVFRKGRGAATAPSSARRQVMEVVEMEGGWTPEALKEMEEENARYQKADAESVEDAEDFGEGVPKSKSRKALTQGTGKKEKRKRR